MAGDIVPIELGLTNGNVFTLWAPRWREGDDEWEAFLGLEEDLYGLPGVAELAAFIRSGAENDLEDHPTWETLKQVSADELLPDDRHTYDLVGVPELAAEDPTPEVIAELAAAGERCFLELSPAAALRGSARLIKLNTDDHPAAGSMFGIRGIPLLVAFQGGREKARQAGVQPAAQIETWIRSLAA